MSVIRPVRKLEEVERDEILNAIEAKDGSIYQAAAALGMTYKTVQKRLRSYGVKALTIRQIRKVQRRLEL